MRNDRLLQVFCVLLLAAGAALIVRGVRHPPKARRTETPATELRVSPTFPAPSPGPPTLAPKAISAAPAAPSPVLSPIRPISVEQFLARPRRLDRHPMEVGRCRLVEHWTSGFCYVFSLSTNRKISQRDDALCTDLPEQRRRMRAAIESGECR